MQQSRKLAVKFFAEIAEEVYLDKYPLGRGVRRVMLCQTVYWIDSLKKVYWT